MTSILKIIIITTSRLIDSFDVLGITRDRTAGFYSLLTATTQPREI